MNEYMIYALLTLGKLAPIFGGLNAICIIALILLSISIFAMVCDNYDKYTKPISTLTSAAKKVAVVFLVSLILGTVIPTTQELAAIILLPKIANSTAASTASRIPNKLLIKLEKELDEWIDSKKAE